MPGGPQKRGAKQREKAAKRDFIAENLHALFENAAEEPLPEPLAALLARLAAEERGE